MQTRQPQRKKNERFGFIKGWGSPKTFESKKKRVCNFEINLVGMFFPDMAEFETVGMFLFFGLRILILRFEITDHKTKWLFAAKVLTLKFLSVL